MFAYPKSAHVWTETIDGYWRCINHDLPANQVLATYLWVYGFDIPETVTYCLAENQDYRLKYRVHGKYIITYITKQKLL